MSDLIKRAAALELLAMLPTSIGPGGAALSIPPEVFRRNAQDAIKAIPPATALAEAQAEIARLRGLLIEERTETLWYAYHTGHEKNGMWDHCCMSDGEWLAAECGLPPSQRIYSAEAIKAGIPVAARRAALSRPHATKGEAG